MWSSSTPAEAAQLFGGIAAPWWVAGGWAIDLWLGIPTRAHEDLDVAILRRDLSTFRARLDGWDLHIANEGALRALAPNDVEPPVHAIWCRPSPSDPWAFELLLNEAEGGDWVFRRDPTIRRPITAISRTSEDDQIPFLAPEVVLLFKAKQRRERDEEDFRRVLPTMTDGQTAWLRASLVTWDSAHPWLAQLPRAVAVPR